MDDQAVVYLVQDEANGWVKIGHSSYLKGRLRGLRSNPRRRLGGKVGRLHVLATFPATPRLEQHYQREFAEWRIDGEWFLPHLDIIMFAKRVREGLDHAEAYTSARHLAMGNRAARHA